MTLEEFAALRLGDVVENHFLHSRGKVREIKHDGIHVAWGGDNVVSFFYSVHSTAWMHWSKAEGRENER